MSVYLEFSRIFYQNINMVKQKKKKTFDASANPVFTLQDVPYTNKRRRARLGR